MTGVGHLTRVTFVSFFSILLFPNNSDHWSDILFLGSLMCWNCVSMSTKISKNGGTMFFHRGWKICFGGSKHVSAYAQNAEGGLKAGLRSPARFADVDPPKQFSGDAFSHPNLFQFWDKWVFNPVFVLRHQKKFNSQNFRLDHFKLVLLPER